MESYNYLGRTIIILTLFVKKYIFGKKYILSKPSDPVSHFKKAPNLDTDQDQSLP